ncbi:hypothetical protein D3C80_1806280 [compost metagenome]
MVDPGVEQDAFGGGGLAGVNMGDDADVAVQLDGGGARHEGSPVCDADEEGTPKVAEVRRLARRGMAEQASSMA